LNKPFTHLTSKYFTGKSTVGIVHSDKVLKRDKEGSERELLRRQRMRTTSLTIDLQI
jgi:hypothetical protein